MMIKLLWDESLETGIIEIDIQHRNLFNIFKILTDSIDNGKSAKIIEYILEEIERYSIYHINAEEEILNRYGIYNEEHFKEHQFFKSTISEFKEKYIIEKDKLLAIKIHKYLYSWLTNHIMKTDIEDMAKLKNAFVKLGKKVEES
jgi:hemerythrin